jgi:peptidoglycan/xylan/chitin deacetylase (PgdA/CDA1 family)
VSVRGRLVGLASSTARIGAFGSFVGQLERLARPDRHRLIALMYHRVDEPARSPALYPGLISATPLEFAEQMRFLAARYRLLALDDLLAVRRGERELEGPAVIVTFDDGYRDFAEHAWPEMRRYGIPATLFVATAFAGRACAAFWWDRLYEALRRTQRDRVDSPLGRLALACPADRVAAFRRLRDYLKALPHHEALALVEQLAAALDAPQPAAAVLGWDELRALAAEGVAIAPHTRTHPILTRVGADEARREIAGSLADLERELGTVPRVFSYPSGVESEEALDALRREGFELAFTGRRGANDVRAADWLRLARINVGRRSPLPVIRLQLAFPARLAREAAPRG